MRLAGVILIALALVAFCATFAGWSRRADPLRVSWQRTASARPDGRPVFVYSRAALNDPLESASLSNPIVADALNTLFDPRLTDERTEAIRITSADGTELVPPLKPGDGVGPLLRAMEQALRAAKREVPEYLSLVAGEYAPERQETARFAVTCYWKGEQRLGGLPGVVGVRTGSLDGEELVEVRFDPTRVSRQTLGEQASSMSCYRGERQTKMDDPLDSSNQQQYHLWLHKSWHFVPLTQLQATRVNATLVSGESPERFLSPTQLGIHRKLQRAYDDDRSALDPLESLRVDRTPEGIASYARKIVSRIW